MSATDALRRPGRPAITDPALRRERYTTRLPSWIVSWLRLNSRITGVCASEVIEDALRRTIASMAAGDDTAPEGFYPVNPPGKPRQLPRKKPPKGGLFFSVASQVLLQ
jgi:hypothetical protein